MIDLDIRKFFDTMPWDLAVKAVQAVTDLPWVVLYVRRWLAAPLALPDGTLQQRDRGTPQGSAVSPVIANLFLHYAFDMWMARKFPGVAFERYVDDAVIHCVSERQAREVLAALQERMSEVGLELHPDKTRIVYCQDARRRGSHEHTSFTFLGYGFRGRRVRTRSGRITTGFVPAISKDAMNKISSVVRSWRLHTRTNLSEADLARRINPVVRGSPPTSASACRTPPSATCAPSSGARSSGGCGANTAGATGKNSAALPAAEAAGDSAGQLLNRVFERFRFAVWLTAWSVTR